MSSSLVKRLLDLNENNIENAYIGLNMTKGKGKAPCIDAWLKDNTDIYDTYWPYHDNKQSVRTRKKNFHVGNIVYGFFQLPENIYHYLLVSVGRITKIPENDTAEFIPIKEFDDLIGRLVINIKEKTNAMGRYMFRMRNQIDKIEIFEVLDKKYGEAPFPGYNNFGYKSFHELKRNINSDDWTKNLKCVFGIYLITDNETKKKYIGSAYGNDGLFGRWSIYLTSGYDKDEENNGSYPNKGLKKIYDEKGLDYIENNFYFSILEILPNNKTADQVIDRESYWKDILKTRKEDNGLNFN